MSVYDRYERFTLEGKRRIRATQACTQCRKKKMRCDGTMPACYNCQDLSIPCEYATPRKRGPRKGYVQLLEERISMLERRLNIRDHPERWRTEAHENTAPSSTNAMSKNMSFQDVNSLCRTQYERNQLEEPQLKPSLCLGNDLSDNMSYPPLEDIIYLADLCFFHTHAAYAYIHRISFMQSIRDGSFSRPLLWSVLAMGARFSNDEKFKHGSPYSSSERFYTIATSLINSTLFEPTVSNLQFWGIMSCLEYGRASGSRARVYGGLALRICQKLGLGNEKALCTPILSKDGSVDTVAMSLRRQIFWSCVSFDKMASAGTGQPQCFDERDTDATFPTIAETILLRDSTQNSNTNRDIVSSDSLINANIYNLKMVLLFGDIVKAMNRANSTSSCVVWPPVMGFAQLNERLHQWKAELPDNIQFTEHNMAIHRANACKQSVDTWLTGHALWCTSMLLLHRGSLSYADLGSSDIGHDTSARINASIEICQTCINDAMCVFEAIKALCGFRALPYLSYNAYIFSTVITSSAFTKTSAGYQKCTTGLKIILDLVEDRKRYWPMYDRLAATTKRLLASHTRHCDVVIGEQPPLPTSQQQYRQPQRDSDTTTFHPPPQTHNTALQLLSHDPLPRFATYQSDANYQTNSDWESMNSNLSAQEQQPKLSLPALESLSNTNGNNKMSFADRNTFLYSNHTFSQPTPKTMHTPSTLRSSSLAEASSLVSPVSFNNAPTMENSNTISHLLASCSVPPRRPLETFPRSTWNASS